MSFPFIYENNFETLLHGATASSGTLIDFPHYSKLANIGMAPYRGAGCLRVALAGGTTSQFVREDTGFDGLTAGVTRYLRFYFYLGKNFAMADGDKFSLVELESTLNTTTEVAAGIQRVGANLFFWYDETSASSLGSINLGTTSTSLGKWYSAELEIVIDSGGLDGTLVGIINDVAGGSVTTLTQAAIVDAKFGVIAPDAGTSGTVLIDDIILDDTQIFRNKERFPGINIHVTHTADHPIIGPARFSAGVTGTGTNAVLSLYDTDGVPTNLTPFVVLRNVSANEFIPGHDIFEVKYGVYAIMSGTAAQAFFSVDRGGVLSDGQYVARGRATMKVQP